MITSQQNLTSISQLGDDCLCAVFCELSPNQIMSCREVSKKWHTFIFSAFPMLKTLCDHKIKLKENFEYARDLNHKALKIKDESSPTRMLRSGLNKIYNIAPVVRFFNILKALIILYFLCRNYFLLLL